MGYNLYKMMGNGYMICTINGTILDMELVTNDKNVKQQKNDMKLKSRASLPV
jgi:hypothetical protein